MSAAGDAALAELLAELRAAVDLLEQLERLRRMPGLPRDALEKSDANLGQAVPLFGILTRLLILERIRLEGLVDAELVRLRPGGSA